VNSYSPNYCPPDSTIDTSSTFYEFGDTIAVNLDGGDTIFIINDIIDTAMANGRIIGTGDIIVALTNHQNELPDEMYGVNLADFFMPGHASDSDNVEYATGTNPWELLAEMAPNVLRYPGGSSSKFRHAFGSMNTNNGTPNALLKNGGNGISLEEIIEFYDKTALPFASPTCLEVYNDYEADTILDGTWLAANQKENFIDFYNEWKNQPHYNPSDTAYDEIYKEPLYINQLIDLVEQIETANPGLTVKIMYVVNIMSEPVMQVINLINYLQDEELNNEFSVSVYGLELGNECYFDIFDSLIGFGCYDGNSAFEHYWEYVNGTEDYDSAFATSGDFDLEQVMTVAGMTGMEGGFQKHDYIGAIRADETLDDIKIGIPVRNPDVDTGAFIIAPQDDLVLGAIAGGSCTSWNEDVYSKYGALEAGKPAFDAIIPHQYYTSQNDGVPDSNTNWGNIPLGLDDPLVEGDNCLDNDSDDEIHDNFTTIYTYATEDTRLECAFRGIVGTSGYYSVGSFNEFIKTRHKEAMIDLSAELSLGESETNPKETWITEWNIKNNNSFDDTDAVNKDVRLEVYNNTIAHAYIIQEQYLNTLKFNNIKNETFRENFITVTTLQNYLGGSSIQLVTKAKKQDMVALGLSGSCSGIGFKNYVPRTLYHSYKLLNQLNLNNLNYVKSNKTIYASNINQPPTMFITPYNPSDLERDVYGYFTNVKDEPQTFIVRPGTLIPVSLTGTNAEIHCVVGEQLYSIAGYSEFFDINDYYSNCYAPAPTNYYELDSDTTYIDYTACPVDMPSGAMCVTVPAYSVGYFVFSYNPSLREGEVIEKFQLYPNPASTGITIKQTNVTESETSELFVNIFTILGVHISSTIISEGGQVDISDLPVGIYTIQIRTQENNIETLSFVKVK